MKYAPILIPTLCRDKHFIRCIESLKKNTWAKFTDIYIALDYPLKDEHKEGYEVICDYLSNDFTEFHSFNVIKRNENYGSSRNMIELREFVLQKHDRFIITDDDVEFSPNFIEYMDKCLEYYENDPAIIGVTGYSYPINWSVSKQANVFKCNVNFPMWGTGFWRDKFLFDSNRLKANYLASQFDAALKNKSYKKMIDKRYMSFVSSKLGDNELTRRCSDVAYGCYLAIENKYIIMPTISKSRNYGFDGSGCYCQLISNSSKKRITASNFDYTKQVIDGDHFFDICPDNLQDDEGNRILLNKFDKENKLYLFKAKIKVLIYKILGKKGYEKLYKFFSQNGK